ncbi:RhoGAP domain-containing protein [Phlyctema vagabunda]|uniref:RhoGAP domain-containing protein n=1 Tax=Phlyctema vagabunda TaxID=108571 RepID=A0ABR4P3G9_9HELO
MSQYQNARDAAGATAQLDFFPHESSTAVGAGRKTVQSSQNIHTPVAAIDRSQRRPSPLVQTSTTSPSMSATPTRTTFSGAAGDHTSSPTDISESPKDYSRLPKERLDDLLATEKSFYKSEDSSAESISKGKNSSRFPYPPTDSNGISRNVADPALNHKPLGSSTLSSKPMAATAPPHRVEMGRAPPRQSSIDSAISSMSDGGSQKTSDSRAENSSANIANLIQTAGSAEAVIQYLLKDKQSQAAQNAQLWRLVDKQRAMILGLNKDLERSLKDKERYRKKLKDNMALFSNHSPSDSIPGAGSDAGSVSSTKAPEVLKAGNVEALVSAGLRDAENENPPSPIDVALAPYPITPPANQTAMLATPGLSNMVEAEHKMPSPTAHAFQAYDADAQINGFEAGRKASAALEAPYNASLPPSRSLPANPPPRGPPPSLPPPKVPMSSQIGGFTVSIIEASPNIDRGAPKLSPPPRKAPPAPLNLGKKHDPSAHLHLAGTEDESDSDYDDILEVDEIPVFTERGRRKTREEDDRSREVAAQKDAEMRSLSKKSPASGKSTPKSRPVTPKEADPMPTSPRQAVPIPPPHMSAGDTNAGSLAGMLSASAGYANAGVLVSPPLMSPGLPLSPRPMDRAATSPLPRNPRDAQSNASSINSPPMSPRGMGFPGAVPLSPRAPRQPIPLPPGTPMSLSSPDVRGEPVLTAAKRADSAADSSAKGDSPRSQHMPSPIDRDSGIYKGLVTDEYPDLLLPPNALPSIDVKVASSRLKPSRASIMFPKNGEEDPVFTLAIFARSDGKELWRVEKDSSSLAHLDHVLKQSPFFTAKTPERSLFTGHAPAKLDARRVALDRYLEEVLDTQMELSSALELCRYLSTNTMAPNAESLNINGDAIGETPSRKGSGGRSFKNGYLTKRGKNFGGWKARFFVLDGPVFRYFESPGGPHLGTIKLQNAQIGKQQQPAENQSPSRGDADDADDNQYRHAFLILEPKRKDSTSLVRHVLCAESDQERDEWVEALLQWVDYRDEDDHEPERQSHSRQHARSDSAGSAKGHGASSKKKVPRTQTVPEYDDMRAVGYETAKQGSAPRRMQNNDTPSPPSYGYEQDPMLRAPPVQASRNISGPKNVQVIQDSTSWGNKSNMLAPTTTEDKIKQKKRSFFGFGTKPRASYDTQEPAAETPTNLSQMAYEQHGPIRPVFGSPLSEAVKYNHPVNVSIDLPAVVYRCIEYLDAKNASGEEGIFRLSGSNVVIKQLRERFNIEGDVNLVTDDQYYDIHAVASLLKLYLRELPSTILTRELHLEFLAVTELTNVDEKISALNGLVHRLPRANNALLRYLSGFLINIINHQDVNKMSVRNVGIVFSPTLNIPAPVFALFLQQYDGIFGEEPSPHDQFEVTVTAPPLSAEDIRSPRRQKFQDLPTPSYEHSSFPQQPPPSFPAPQHYQQRPAYDTGFTPMQPAYENTMAGPEYGTRAPTLAGPAYDVYSGGGRQYDNSASTKSKRRESTMFGMGGMGMGKKPSSNRLREERLVDEESFY